MSQMNEIQIGGQRRLFFKKFKHWVENNSFKNFTTYWQQQNWAIIFFHFKKLFTIIQIQIQY